MSAEHVGIVADLWRYPVKSFGGESTRQTFIGPFGPIGDRRHAVVNRDGEPLSARRQSKLLGYRARYADAEAVEDVNAGELLRCLRSGHQVGLGERRRPGGDRTWLKSPREPGTIGGHGAGWSSLVARRAHNPKVAGSNPAPAIYRKARNCGPFFSFWLDWCDDDAAKAAGRHRGDDADHCGRRCLVPLADQPGSS